MLIIRAAYSQSDVNLYVIIRIFIIVTIEVIVSKLLTFFPIYWTRVIFQINDLYKKKKNYLKELLERKKNITR